MTQTSPQEPAEPRTTWSFLRPRRTRAQVLAALLCGLLGFALVVQARSNEGQGLASLRQSDLVVLLDTVTQRSDRLEQEARRLEQTRAELQSGSDNAQAAQQAARQRLDVLGVLAGTVPATGPGIVLRIADPSGSVDAATLVGALQELRDAGAEAVQIGNVRVVASTAFTDATGGVDADGRLLSPPYEFLAIGDPQTLSAALAIPGGVLDTLTQLKATGAVSTPSTVEVTAVVPATTSSLASPASSGGATPGH